MVLRFITHVKANQYFYTQRNEQSTYWMYETINEQLRNSFYRDSEIQILIDETEKRILSNEISSFTGAKILLEKYFKTS